MLPLVLFLMLFYAISILLALFNRTAATRHYHKTFFETMLIKSDSKAQPDFKLFDFHFIDLYDCSPIVCVWHTAIVYVEHLARGFFAPQSICDKRFAQMNLRLSSVNFTG